MDTTYEQLAQFFGAIAFVIAWIYFTITQGFLGFCLGWFPAIFIGGIVGFLWPIAVGGFILLSIIGIFSAVL